MVTKNAVFMRSVAFRKRLSNIIMRGDKEAVAEHLKAMKPAILDILPLTLEEVFTYEMETLGYVFNPEIFEKEDRA